MGEASAATVVDVVTTGGRRFENGLMVNRRVGSDLQTHQLPDGQTIMSAAPTRPRPFRRQPSHSRWRHLHPELQRRTPRERVMASWYLDLAVDIHSKWWLAATTTPAEGEQSITR